MKEKGKHPTGRHRSGVKQLRKERMDEKRTWKRLRRRSFGRTETDGEARL
jgi:hypothetical protein